MLVTVEDTTSAVEGGNRDVIDQNLLLDSADQRSQLSDGCKEVESKEEAEEEKVQTSPSHQDQAAFQRAEEAPKDISTESNQ